MTEIDPGITEATTVVANEIPVPGEGRVSANDELKRIAAIDAIAARAQFMAGRPSVGKDGIRRLLNEIAPVEEEEKS